MINFWWQLILSFLKNNMALMLVTAAAFIVFFIAVKKIKRRLQAENANRPLLLTALVMVLVLFFGFFTYSVRRSMAYVYFYYGLKCLNNNRHDLAFEEFREAHRLDPKNENILNLLAFSAYSSQTLDVSLEYFGMLKNLDMTSDLGIYYGHVLLLSGQTEKAHTILKLACEHAENPAFAHFYMGDYHKQKKEYDRALKSYEKALEMSGNHRNFVRLHMAHFFKERDNRTREVEYLEKIIRDPGTETDIAKQAGLLLEKYGKNKKEEESHEKVLEQAEE